MHTISLTIGRNVDAEPMSDDLWTMFKAVTRMTLEEYRHDAIECHEGRGTWYGVTEDSYKVTILATQQWTDAVTRGESECVLSGREARDPDPRREHGLAPRESVSYGR
jgi:hypothetical protein